ncbi:hypothetical protein M433DRAFT_427875 [Acidomyces richmondensis BFW]|nr:hypothetical protein M433DRAFT_427875 [Acidomyces richmondensis BFW]
MSKLLVMLVFGLTTPTAARASSTIEVVNFTSCGPYALGVNRKASNGYNGSRWGYDYIKTLMLDSAPNQQGQVLRGSTEDEIPGCFILDLYLRTMNHTLPFYPLRCLHELAPFE